MNERQQVDITAPVLAATGTLLLGVGVAFAVGAIPRALSAAAASALALVLVLLGVSLVELIDSRVSVRWMSDDLPGWWRHPAAPIAALAAGVALGYFFW